ncbi:MAG TPA: RT0821/Lpp0805 family surface protein [Alphaproteobacteria bacterium]
MWKVIGFAFLALAIGGTVMVPTARAQYSHTFPRNFRLTQGDLDMMKQAARGGMEGKPDGTVIPWSNAKSGNSGTVTLLKRAEVKGQECRDILHTIKAKNVAEPARYEVTLCRQPDGTWKIPAK